MRDWGAGSNGSSIIKAVLRFRPGKVVIDHNENGLAEMVVFVGNR